MGTDIAIAVVIVVLVIIVVIGAMAATRKKPPDPAIGGLNQATHINPPAANQLRLGKGPGDPGFKVISVTSGQPPPFITAPGTGTVQPGKPSETFSFVKVSQNLTAICKLTGKPAGECTCDRHKGAR